MTAIRLLIVDDHPIMRDGLRGVFSDDPDFEVGCRPWAASRPSPGCGSWATRPAC
jgi:hypothetical protein